MDATRPNLSNSVSFSVHVNDYIEMFAGSTTNALLAGASGSAPIDFVTSTRLLGLQSLLQFDATRLTNLTVDALLPAQADVSLTLMPPNIAAITFTPVGAQTLLGTQHLARLRFTAITNRPSAFVPLHFTGLSATRATTGSVPTALAVDGRVALIGTQPLLEATGARSMSIYGIPGITYTIQQTTNVGDTAAWTVRGNVAMGTNLVKAVSVPVAPYIIYRLRQLP